MLTTEDLSVEALSVERPPAAAKPGVRRPSSSQRARRGGVRGPPRASRRGGRDLVHAPARRTRSGARSVGRPALDRRVEKAAAAIDDLPTTTLRAARTSGIFLHELLERVPLASFAPPPATRPSRRGARAKT